MEAGYSKRLHSLNISEDNSSFIHLNIRSAVESMSQFENYLQNIYHKFTFIGLSGTWINKLNADLFSIHGYICENKFRACKRRRIILICIMDQVPSTLRNDLIIFQIYVECIFIEVEGKYLKSDVSVIISVIYRQPDNGINVSYTETY